MKVSSQLKGGIYEVSFGYHPNLEGYTTLMSDIPKLYAIVSKRVNKREDIMKLKHMHAQEMIGGI